MGQWVILLSEVILPVWPGLPNKKMLAQWVAHHTIRSDYNEENPTAGE